MDEAVSSLRDGQYGDSSNFGARIALHRRFGTNHEPWPRWVFDRFMRGERLRVLELGCGMGILWLANADRVPAGWEFTLSDFSEGMLRGAEKRLAGVLPRAVFEVMDAQRIPRDAGTFDMVIANHMLYHVPDRKAALGEIRRVLRDDGLLYATTLRGGYMNEMKDLLRAFRSMPPATGGSGGVIAGFSLENGEAQLREFFGTVSVMVYGNDMEIDEAAPFVDYVFSCNGIDGRRILLREEEREAFTAFVDGRIRREGRIVIPSDFGLFVCGE
ncbi:MAG: class I SAM-dependent methyltransferase [Spirochaetes bacterium]|nr:class I SAM-dependent methyltransferase [Spirochaetota bacterium]